jgi:transcription termination/antitermination protein NusG
MLPDTLQSVDNAPHPWCVLQAKPNMDRPLAQYLGRFGLNYFLPLRTVQKPYWASGKRVKRKVIELLFPGYIFLSGTKDDYYRAVASEKVCGFIAVVDQEKLRGELLALERALIECPRLGIREIPRGAKCRVTAGPFEGQEGIVEENGRAMIVLSVSILGQSVAMQIDSSFVEVQ